MKAISLWLIVKGDYIYINKHDSGAAPRSPTSQTPVPASEWTPCHHSDTSTSILCPGCAPSPSDRLADPALGFWEVGQLDPAFLMGRIIWESPDLGNSLRPLQAAFRAPSLWNGECIWYCCNHWNHWNHCQSICIILICKTALQFCAISGAWQSPLGSTYVKLAVSTHPHKLVEWEYHGLSVTCLMAALAGHMCSKYKH